MDKVCRLCLQLEANMTPIFYGNNGTSDLRLQIQNLCFVEVSENDVLPKMICGNCEGKLSFVEEFRKQCKQSDHKLREHYKVSSPDEKYRSFLTVLQNVAVQTEDKFDTNTISNHSWDTVKSSRRSWEDDNAQDTDDDKERNKTSDSVVGGSYSSNKYKSVGCRVKKNDPNLRKRVRGQLSTAKALGKKKPKKLGNKEKYVCNLCKKVYVSKKALLKHTGAHLREEIVMCKFCNKVFNGNDKLAEHVKKHSNVTDYKCEVCGMPFKERAKLNFHLRVHGKGPPINTDKRYKCDICSRTFASKSGLRFHVKSHAGIKPYHCKFCNKSFAIHSYKTRHERTHTGDKHFMCHICSASFASANGLKYHLRSHTGEANYHCNTCGKSFRRLKYLKEHTFTHTGERPYVCKICGSSYGNSGSFFVHKKKCNIRSTLGDISHATPVIETNTEVQGT